MLAASAECAAQKQPAEQEQTAAVLKLQEVHFTYRSSSAPLSCTALQTRVAAVLRAVGARQDVQVRVTGCQAVVMPSDDLEIDDAWHHPSDRWDNPSDRWREPSTLSRGRRSEREQFAQVRARAMLPVEVTPEVLEEMRKDKARRELISRVRGDPAAALDDPIVFPAQYENVTLSRRTLGLEPEDCELLDQMSTSVLRKLGLKVVGRGVSCGRNGDSRIPPQLTVRALMPIFERGPVLAPEEKESDP